MTKARHNGRRKASALGKTGAERSAHVMNPKYLAEMERFRLMDDDFMSKCLENAPECIELMLRIILGKKDLKVVKSQTEYPIKSLQGRGVRFDVFARDSEGREYDIEIQRADKGAEPKRARYNSALLDANALKSGEDCGKLRDTYVIIIAENDVLGGGKEIYEIDRTIRQMRGKKFGDGTHIIYVNGVDEGRILSSAKGADRGGAQLPLRIVGDTFQAAYDARIAKQIFDSGAEYFASWGYLSGPDTFFEGLPSVSFHVARESARFKGMRRLSVTVSGAARKGTEADAVAALSPDGGTLRVMAYAFRNEQFAKGSTPFHVAVKLPAGWAGREIAVTRKQVDDDANWFDEWRAECAKRKIGNDRFGWSPDGPAPMQERIGLKSKADRELFQKEIEPKLRARARLGSRTERMRAPDGALSFDCALPDNAVLFIELSMP